MKKLKGVIAERLLVGSQDWELKTKGVTGVPAGNAFTLKPWRES